MALSGAGAAQSAAGMASGINEAAKAYRQWKEINVLKNLEEGGPERINIDTGTAFAFISQDSPVRYELKEYVKGKDMVMTETALEEFNNAVAKVGGNLEQSRAERFLKRITIIPDNPSDRAMNLRITRRLGANDKIIFGTGDNLNIVTMTSDAKFVRAASAQGVDFNVYVHTSRPLQGK